MRHDVDNNEFHVRHSRQYMIHGVTPKTTWTSAGSSHDYRGTCTRLALSEMLMSLNILLFITWRI